MVTEHFSQGFSPFCSFLWVLPVLNATMIVVFRFSPLFVAGQEAEQWRSDIEEYVEQLRTWFNYVQTLEASANFPTIDFDSIVNSLSKFWIYTYYIPCNLDCLNFTRLNKSVILALIFRFSLTNMS